MALPFLTGFSRLEVPEQALDGIPLGLGMVVEINLLNFHIVLDLLLHFENHTHLATEGLAR